MHPLNSKTTRGIVVEITDETGRPVESAAVSFRMPEEGPGGSFEHGMRTEIRSTTPDGIASVRTFQTGNLKGPFQVRVTAAKNQVRAGTVVSQYISDSVSARRSAPAAGGTGSKGHGRRWLIIAAVAGAAAAGVFAGMSGGGNSGGSTPATTAPPLPQIGTPSVVIGGPQ